MSSHPEQNHDEATPTPAGTVNPETARHAHLTAEEFRQVCSHFSTGVAIATVIGSDGQPHGLTVNSFTSVSLHPPLVLVCVGRKSSVHKHFWGARSFAINVLEQTQQELSHRFSRSIPNRFAGVRWNPAMTGAPVIDGVLAWLDCETRERIVAGDHTVYVGHVRYGEAKDGLPLVFFESAYARIAKE